MADDPQGLRDRGRNPGFPNCADTWMPNARTPVEAVRFVAGPRREPTWTSTLRWELARSQGILGVSLISKKSQEALDWLQKSYEGFEALRREEPANAQYQGDSAKVLARMASALGR